MKSSENANQAFLAKLATASTDSEYFGYVRGWVKGEGNYRNISLEDRMTCFIRELSVLSKTGRIIGCSELFSNLTLLAIAATFRKDDHVLLFKDDWPVMELLKILGVEGLYKWCMISGKQREVVEEFLQTFSRWWRLKSAPPHAKLPLPEDWITAAIESGNCELLSFTTDGTGTNPHDERVLRLLTARVKKSLDECGNIESLLNQSERLGNGHTNLDRVRAQALAVELFRFGRFTMADIKARI
jgi:hypothetical protein